MPVHWSEMEYDRTPLPDVYRAARTPPTDRKIALRGLSALQLISDDAFARGLRDLGVYCRSAERDEPIYEPVELSLFERQSEAKTRELL